MQWPQENIPIKITNTKKTKKSIILMKEIINIHQTIITSETPTRAFSVASCDAGGIVLEGGGSVANFLDEGLGNVFQIFRETVNEGNGYQVGGVGTNLTSFDSNAICIDNPPLRP